MALVVGPAPPTPSRAFLVAVTGAAAVGGEGGGGERMALTRDGLSGDVGPRRPICVVVFAAAAAVSGGPARLAPRPRVPPRRRLPRRPAAVPSSPWRPRRRCHGGACLWAPPPRRRWRRQPRAAVAAWRAGSARLGAAAAAGRRPPPTPPRAPADPKKTAQKKNASPLVKRETQHKTYTLHPSRKRERRRSIYGPASRRYVWSEERFLFSQTQICKDLAWDGLLRACQAGLSAFGLVCQT